MHVPGPLLAAFAAAAALGLATPNPWLTAASILVLPLFIRLLWRPGEPPVLLFAVSFQWLQVTAKVFQANAAGVHVALMSGSTMVEAAIWTGLGALVVLAAGMRVGLRWLRARGDHRAQAEAMQLSPERLFVVFLGVFFVVRVLREVAWAIPGLTQPILALMSVRWVVFFLLAYVVLQQRRRYVWLLVATGLSFVEGVGFFSGFKTVLFFLLIAFFTTYRRLQPKTVVTGAVLGALLLVLGSAWTVVKPDYRAFLNEGTGLQTVKVDRTDQLRKLWELTTALSWTDIQAGMDPLFNRVAYVDYLAYTMEYVPAFTPHERGAVWAAAFQHTFMPRLFFPDKPRLPSDSEHTMRYTGLNLAGDAQGTSISIGYVGDSYIDFGQWGLFVPVFLLGVLWGLMYTYFMKKARVQLFGYAFATAVLINAHLFEIVALKLIGGTTLAFLLFALLLKFGERPLWRLLKPAPAAPRNLAARRELRYGAPPAPAAP